METLAFMRKGYFFQKLEELSRNPSARDAFLEALRSDPARDYVTSLRDFGLLEPNRPEMAHQPNRQEAHLRKHWFPKDPNAYGAWWPEWQPIEPILRRGCIKALEAAQQHNWPIDGYWISTGNRVAVGIGVDAQAQQITLIRVTPPCPGYKPDTSLIAVVDFRGSEALGGVVETTTVIGPKPVTSTWTQTERERRLV
jgi:hypothetical protein